MTKLAELVEWLEMKREQARAETKRGQVLAFAHAADKARALLAAEQKPTADKMERRIPRTVRVVCPLKDPQRCVSCMDSSPCDGYIHIDLPDEFLSRYTPAPSEEPLACLADKKGLSVYIRRRIKGFVPSLQWAISINKRGGGTVGVFCDATYPAAEQAARQYLNGLPDKGGK